MFSSGPQFCRQRSRCSRSLCRKRTVRAVERSSERSVLVRSPSANRLRELILAEGGQARPDGYA